MTMMVHDQSSDPQGSPTLTNKRKAEDEDSLDSLSDDGSDASKSMKKSKHCRASKAKWTQEEDEILTRAVMMSGEGNWKKIAQSLNDRSHLQCLHRWQKVLNPALVKGPWKEEEDSKLTELVEKYGPKDWSTIAAHIPGRIGKQCRERWFNHLSPDVRKTNWTPEEDKIIIDAHSKIGNKWTNISKLLEGRPANAIKNHWNSTLLKRIQDSNGEPTPRRDRNRNKKPPPLRATEFDFRMQQLQSQQFEDSSETSSAAPSPQQLQAQSVATENAAHTLTPEQQALGNMVRFQAFPPEILSHVFFNPFTDHSQLGLIAPSLAHPPAVLTAGGAASAWDSWPAPNVIHLNPPATSTPAAAHTPAFTHTPNVLTSPKVNAAGSFVTQPSANYNPLAAALGVSSSSFPNVMSVMDAYNSEFGLGSLGSIDNAHEYFAELYANTPSSLPTELQYCFDHSQLQQQQLQQLQQLQQQQLQQQQQQLQQIKTESVTFPDANNVNVNNMGLLSLEVPGFCALDL